MRSGCKAFCLFCCLFVLIHPPTCTPIPWYWLFHCWHWCCYWPSFSGTPVRWSRTSQCKRTSVETTPQTRRSWRAASVSNPTRMKAVSEMDHWRLIVMLCTCVQSAPQLQFSQIQWWIAQLLSSSVKDSTVQRSDYWMLKFRQHAFASRDQ